MKKNIAFLLLFSAAIWTSCNSDVDFGSGDNLPKIVDAMLGMTPEQAITYMQKEGFTYEGEELHAKHPREFIFSKGAENGQFSFEAPIVIWAEIVWTQNDTINSVDAEQLADSKKSARDLYWKWSHYTESAFASQLTEWYGSLWINSETFYRNREEFWTDYKNAPDSLLIVYEYYGDRDKPKDISMGLNFEDPAWYRMFYITHAYDNIPMPE